MKINLLILFTLSTQFLKIPKQNLQQIQQNLLNIQNFSFRSILMKRSTSISATAENYQSRKISILSSLTIAQTRIPSNKQKKKLPKRSFSTISPKSKLSQRKSQIMNSSIRQQMSLSSTDILQKNIQKQYFTSPDRSKPLVRQNSNSIKDLLQSMKLPLKPCPLKQRSKAKSGTNFAWTMSLSKQKAQVNRNNKSNLVKALNINLTFLGNLCPNLIKQNNRFNRSSGKLSSLRSQTQWEVNTIQAWVDALIHLKEKIAQANKKFNVFSQDFWNVIYEKFQYFSLNIDEKIQFLQLISKFFEGNYGMLKVNTPNEFYEEMGMKFNQLENRIHFKHKHCLQYLKFMIETMNHQERFYPLHFSELKFDMSVEETQKIASTVRLFFQNNVDSFAFLTLYFQVSIIKKIRKQNLKTVEQEYITRLKHLQQLYPANNAQILRHEEIDKKDVTLQSFSCSQRQIFQFDDSINKSHYEQLRQLILKKSQQAKQEETYFRQLVEDMVYKHGYSFKCGVKINNSQNTSAIFRVIEKMIYKQKYENHFQALKLNLVRKHQDLKAMSIDEIREYVQGQKKQVREKITQILQKQTSIQIYANDLLRAKCTFSNVSEIVETAKMLTNHLIQQNHQILQLKNRLHMNTKDITLLIKLPNSIAQLQLALKLDSVSNQFNHRLYQLKRSKVYTPFTNLVIHNQKWSQLFFTQLNQTFEQILKFNRQPNLNQNITFKRFRRDMDKFKRNYLALTQVFSVKKYDVKQQQKLKMIRKAEQIQIFIDKIQEKDLEKGKYFSYKTQLEIYFYKGFDKEKALQEFDKYDMKQCQSKPQILKLKADILKIQAHFEESLICYKKYVRLCQQAQNIQAMAKVYHQIGSIYQIRQQYEQAFNYYEKSLELKKIRSKDSQDSLDTASTLNSMGNVWMKVNKWDQAFNYFEKSLAIRENAFGKESNEVATTFRDIGQLYFRKEEYNKSLDYYKRSFEVTVKVNGHDSIEAAKSLYSLGKIYLKTRNLEKAMQNFKNSLWIREKILGHQNIDTARSYFRLSEVYQELHLYKKAVQNAHISTHILTKILGSQHISTIQSYTQQNDLISKVQIQKKRNAKKQLFLQALKSFKFTDLIKGQIKNGIKSNDNLAQIF